MPPITNVRTHVPQTVSVVVPCRNEVKCISAFLDSLCHQELENLDWEVIIADGLSDDGTREVLLEYSHEHPWVRVIDNPGRIVSSGLNAAIRFAKGEVILRMDAHTEYPADYIRRCLEVLEGTGALNVGGPCIARGKGYIGRAIAAAFQSAFAVGGARWHQPTHEGAVDTVHLGCWRREVLWQIGLFDETLVRNQDDELNLRLVRSGGQVWQSPKIVSWYRTRSSLSALFRQYFQYGFWKVAVIQKHHLPASWRHLIPATFILANLVGLAAVAVSKGVGLASLSSVPIPALAVIDIAYVLVSLFSAVIVAARAGWRLLPVLPIVFAIYHIAYGVGFLMGLFHFWMKRGNTRHSETIFTQITR